MLKRANAKLTLAIPAPSLCHPVGNHGDNRKAHSGDDAKPEIAITEPDIDNLFQSVGANKGFNHAFWQVAQPMR